MVSLAASSAWQVFWGVKDYMFACKPFLGYVVVTLALNSPVCYWAVRATAGFFECPHRTWLFGSALFSLAHIVATIYIAIKLDAEYEDDNDNTLLLIVDEIETGTGTDYNDDSLASKIPTTIRALSEKDVGLSMSPVTLTHSGSKQDDDDSPRFASSCVGNLMHVPSPPTITDNHPPVSPPRPSQQQPRHESTTPSNSMKRIAHITIYDKGVKLYQVLWVVWYLWIAYVTLDHTDNDDGHDRPTDGAACDQFANWISMANLLKSMYFFFTTLVWVCIWVIWDPVSTLMAPATAAA